MVSKLAALCAALVGLGWLVAIGITLFVWTPAGLTPRLAADGALYLEFIHEQAVSWRIFHNGTTVGLAAALLLPVLLHGLLAEDETGLGRAAALVGVGGGFCALVASLIDHLGTPVLARTYAAAPDPARRTAALLVWEWMEPWRNTGLKTVAFLFLGLWVLWMAWALLRGGRARVFGVATAIVGAALTILGLAECLDVSFLSQEGIGGLALVLIPPWALWLAVWLWRRGN